MKEVYHVLLASEAYDWMKGNTCYKIPVIKARNTVIATEMPKAYRAVHRRGQQKVILIDQKKVISDVH